MTPQITWLTRCIVTLVAFFLLLLFLLLFSFACLRKCIDTAIAVAKYSCWLHFFLHLFLFSFLLQMNPIEIFLGKKPKKIKGKVCLVCSQFLVTATYKFPPLDRHILSVDHISYILFRKGLIHLFRAKTFLIESTN